MDTLLILREFVYYLIYTSEFGGLGYIVIINIYCLYSVLYTEFLSNKAKIINKRLLLILALFLIYSISISFGLGRDYKKNKKKVPLFINLLLLRSFICLYLFYIDYVVYIYLILIPKSFFFSNKMRIL